MKKPIYFIFGAIVILSLAFTVISSLSTKKLGVYNNSDVVEEKISTTESDITADEDMVIVKDDEIGYSVNIPSSWKKVVEDDSTTYIHTQSASSIKIETFDYYPEITNISSEIVSTDLINNGYEFVNFSRLSETSYEALYRVEKDKMYDYIEEVYWSRDHIVKFTCVCNDENYDGISLFYSKIFDSFTWTTSNVVPDGYAVYYISDANFDFGIPIDWSYNIADGAIVASDPDNTSLMTITIIPSDIILTTLTATDMTNFIMGTKSNFMLKSFTNNSDETSSISTYNDNGLTMTNYTRLFSNGSYLYAIQFDYPTEQTDYFSEVASVSCGLFKDYTIIEPSYEDDSNLQDTEDPQNMEDTQNSEEIQPTEQEEVTPSDNLESSQNENASPEPTDDVSSESIEDVPSEDTQSDE